jgi:sugar (pentulose or hexulose) kinase
LTATEYYVGIDLGTSGCRASALSPSGELLGSAAVPLPASVSDDAGTSEQDPEAWWRGVCQVLRELRETVCGRPAGLAVDGTSGTLLLTDGEGRPLTPGLMYDDTRSRSALARVADIAPPSAPVHNPASSLAKLTWLAERGLPAGAAHARHQAEWITGRLSGDFAWGDENNALKLGYDPLLGRWPEWLENSPLPTGLLPRVVPVGQRIGTVCAATAAVTGLSLDTPIYAGTTDSSAAALAAGLEDNGDALTSLGSTLVLKIVSPRPVTSPQHGVYSHRLFGRWLVGGASNSGGGVLRRYFSDEDIERLTRSVDANRPTGLRYYPLPGLGERFPENDPDKAPCLDPRPADDAAFFQGILEGITRIEQQGFQVLHELGAPAARRVFTSGGGTRNPGWQAIRRRVLGIPVLPAVHGEPSVGAAMIARRGSAADQA